MSNLYLHPHVTARLVVEDVFILTGQGNTVGFFPITSPKGKDGVIQTLTSFPEYEERFGDLRDVDGQQNFNLKNFLESGGLARVLRLLHPNATYSNIVVGVGVKADTANGIVTIKPYIREEANLVAPFISDDGVTNTAILRSGIDDGNGFLQYDLVGFTPIGRGTNDDMSVRIVPNVLITREFPDDFMYSVDLMNKVAGVDTTYDTFDVSLNPDTRDISQESVFISDTINFYNTQLVSYGIKENYELMMLEIEKIVDPTTYNLQMLDLLTGSNFDEIVPGNVVVLDTDQTTVDTIAALSTKVQLVNGSDGFPVNSTTGDPLTNISDIREANNDLIARGLRGQIDSTLINDRLYDIDLVFDANYADSVKQAAYDLCTEIRKDCMFICDLGFQKSPESAIAKRAALGFATEHTAIFAQSAYIDDSNTIGQFHVTMPYFLAAKIPLNDDEYSVGRNFAGLRRGNITGYVGNSISWIPNDPQRSELYENQVNYFDDENGLYLDAQQTSRKDNSPVSKVSITRAVFRMMRRAKRIARFTKHEYFEEDVYTELRTNIYEELSDFIADSTCTSIDVSVYSRSYDEKRGILYVEIRPIFKNIIERIILNFVVKR